MCKVFQFHFRPLPECLLLVIPLLPNLHLVVVVVVVFLALWQNYSIKLSLNDSHDSLFSF